MTLLTAFLVVLLPFAAGQSHDSADSTRQGEIAVSGEALVNVVPDRIVITFIVENRDAAISEARRQSAAAVEQTMAALQSVGIGPESVQLDAISISPHYRDRYGSDIEAPEYYVSRTALVVTLSSPNAIDDAVAQALESGVRRVAGISFQTTELKRHRERARELALLAAREKADKMAATLGLDLGAATSIAENRTSSGYASSWNGFGSGRGREMSQVAVRADDDDSDPSLLGIIAVRAQVRVTFSTHAGTAR